jgi:hypothetical protein
MSSTLVLIVNKEGKPRNMPLSWVDLMPMTDPDYDLFGNGTDTYPLEPVDTEMATSIALDAMSRGLCVMCVTGDDDGHDAIAVTFDSAICAFKIQMHVCSLDIERERARRAARSATGADEAPRECYDAVVYFVPSAWREISDPRAHATQAAAVRDVGSLGDARGRLRWCSLA